MRYLAATDGRTANETLLEYLEPRLTHEDTVHVVHSLKGQEADTGVGEDESDVVLESRETLSAMADRLSGRATVETHQLVRGNDPHEDLLQFAVEHDVDELLVGIRQRSTGERVLFGSTAQKVLLNADRPVVAIPLPDE
ncbi:universal stress protein [Natronosalvus caseinilyticus]|uniref:universal stress protein n=1 Tax=Natronosalvus caseinilyticus TaxID=2953747 RepID=UPI0028A5ACD7|nr:universal stress protein [Natronosalvus caseinilyticus]